MSDIFPETPITSLPAAVAFLGALPMPVGSVPQALSAERLAEIRSLDLLALMDDRVAPMISGHLAALLAEVDRLTAQRDRRRTHLVALQNDALNMRGALSPNGEARKVPFPLGPTLLPAVEWLIGRVAELEAELYTEQAQHRTTLEQRNAHAKELLTLRARKSCPCPPADQPGPHQVGCFFDGVPVSPPSERPVNGLTATFAPVASPREVPSGETDPARRAAWRMLSREEPHDSPLHQEHRTPHDLPEGCRLSEEQVRELGNPYLGGGA